MPTNMHCQQCGKEFTCTNREAKAGRKFCSKDCYRAHETVHGRPRPDVVVTTFNCKTCGSPFSRNAGELRSYHKQFGKDPMYCSLNCSAIGRKSVKTRPCAVCGTEFTTTGHSKGRTDTCSDPCRRELQRRKLIATVEAERPFETREMSRNVTRDGYIRMRFPGQNGVKGREVLEHRYIMEQHIGRELRKGETVHHVNGVKTDNRIENLELFDSRHGPGQRVVDQVAFAVDILTDYADFAQKAGFKLVKID